MVEAMRVVLESKDYNVDTASSGNEGLKKIKLSEPDLIILDVMMETKDKGFEIARQIKADKKYKSIPILMLTAIKEKLGLDFKDAAGDATWLPVDDYVEKPLKPSDLLKKVSSLLAKNNP